MVGIGIGANPDSMTASITYAGVAMTSVGKVHNGSGTGGYTELFRLIAPATGANTVTVTLTAAATISAGSVSFTAADQTTPLGPVVLAPGSTSTGTATSVAVPSTTSGNPVIDVASWGSGSSATPGAAPQVQRWQRVTNAATRAGGAAQSTAISPGGTVTLSYTFSPADYWGAIAAEVMPVSGTVAPAPTNQFFHVLAG